MRIFFTIRHQKSMLNDTHFELKDFSRFFHDFFRESMKMQVLSIPIKSTLFELKTHNKLAMAGGFGPPTCSLGESRSIQLSYATASESLQKIDGPIMFPASGSSACTYAVSSKYIL